jgi:hypothetical protein
MQRCEDFKRDIIARGDAEKIAEENQKVLSWIAPFTAKNTSFPPTKFKRKHFQ